MSELLRLHESVVTAIRATAPAPLFPFPLSAPHVQRIDLSERNPRLAALDVSSAECFSEVVQDLIHEQGARYGIGGYAERRTWHRKDSSSPAAAHLGVDIWAPEGIAVYAPYDSIIHSIRSGESGPTIILTHRLNGECFHTLYGHLSGESLVGKRQGQSVRRGELLGSIGGSTVNGGWPPHLHFQVITDMLGQTGDFPKVASDAQRDLFFTLCPNPNLILRSSLLNSGHLTHKPSVERVKGEAHVSLF